MKVVDPGHKYALPCLDEPFNREFLLTFVKREGEKYPGNVGSYPGVNIQEILRAIIDRVKYLDKQVHDRRNENVITSLRHAIWYLEMRAADRHNRDLHIPAGSYIEELPVCEKCLHIGCNGACHD